MRRVRRFLARSGTERRLVVEATLLLSAVRLGLLLLPFRVVSRWALRRPESAGRAENDDRTLRRHIVWAVVRAGRLVPGGRTCLPQALVGQLMLSRAGFTSRLRIGVRKNESGELLAHAWVESRGQVLIGGPASITEYSAFPEMDRIAPRI